MVGLKSHQNVNGDILTADLSQMIEKDQKMKFDKEMKEEKSSKGLKGKLQK